MLASSRGRTALAVAIALVLLGGLLAAATSGDENERSVADDAESVLTAAHTSVAAEAPAEDDEHNTEWAEHRDAETTTTTVAATTSTTSVQPTTSVTAATPATPVTPTHQPPTSPPATAPPQPPPTTVASGAPANPNAKASECESYMIQWVNEARAAAGIHPLTPRSNLSGLARTWSTQLANTGILAHQDQRQIIQLLGASAARENVGQSSSSARSLFDNFMASDTHRANILAANVSQVGIGCVYAGPRVWVTQTFIG